MIIYFLIENVDVDHSPQCLRTHFNIIYEYIYIPLSLGLGPRSVDDVFKSKKCTKKIFPKGKPISECNTFISTTVSQMAVKP